MTAEVAQSAEEQQVVPPKKNFEVLSVIAEKVSGTVKWFSVARRYGFIRRDDNKEDVFVHRTAITASRSHYPSLRNGELVEFSVVETRSGVNAASVTGPNGQNVQGASRFRRFYRPRANGDGQQSGNESARVGGDAEGTRQRGGPRMMRSGRKNFRPNQNGVGDGENVAGGSGEQSEDQAGGLEDARPPRQRPRRYRGAGGRGRGQQRSTSNRQSGGVNGEGGEEGGATDGSRPQGPPRRGGGGFRFRRGGRMRRGGRSRPPRERNGNAEGSGEQNAPEVESESKAEAIANESSGTSEHTEKQEEAPEPEAENLENKMENMSLGASEKPTESTAAAQQPESTEVDSGDASAEAAESSN
ncbi:hypothetical protein Aperf_G00000012720 [Anoplocephala perfoliata]